MADNFDAVVSAITGGVPIALLPVRLEARFFKLSATMDELRVRIYPDQIHIAAHEPALTVEERDAGMLYWDERFRSPDPTTRSKSPWVALSAAVGSGRAAWVARALTPTNLDQVGQPVTPAFPTTELRPSNWSHAAHAVALPERWVVIGLRGDGEVFRKWSKVVSDTLDVTPTPVTDPETDAVPLPDDVLALQPSAKWLVDFDEAERAGMAVRINSEETIDGEPLAQGLDRLYVLGVDWTLGPDQGAELIAELLASHLYMDGLSAIEPGTATNVTSTSRPGQSPTDAALVAALDPEQGPGAAGSTETGVAHLWNALGVATAGDQRVAIPGGAAHERAVASHLANALWESTLGAYLSDFIRLPDSRAVQVRDHVRRYLFPAGPYPAIRIGRQPYGVLPVLALRHFFPGNLMESDLVAVLRKLRPLWDQAVSRVPRLGRSADLEADLTALLQATPLGSTLRFRSAVGPLTVHSTEGLEAHAVAQQYADSALAAYFGFFARPPIRDFMIHPAARVLDVPRVDADALVLGKPLSRNYLKEVVELAKTTGTYDALKAREGTANTLLEVLVVHAVERELHRADLRTIDLHRVASGQIGALPDIGVMGISEYTGIELESLPTSPMEVLVRTPSEAARVVIPSVTGQQTVREFVMAAVADEASVPPEYQPLDGVLQSLGWLAERSAAALDRALLGLLDAYSHRLDAWCTSLAIRRLATVRSATPTGVHVGGYGWLDDLRPAETGENQGFIHAPSFAQASTAAVLRSGYLAHEEPDDPDHKVLDLDLSSDRVRTALALLEGVAQGQPLSALLGYRFERALREHTPTLARFILPLRQLVPLRPEGSTPAPPSTTPSDTLAARDVVDGVGLIDRWRNERFDFLMGVGPGETVATLSPVAEVIGRLADAYDAVADLLVAEAVHQSVQGNHERAGASLAALDHQGLPPRMEFVRTPRTGKSFTQRLLVLIGDESLPASWQSVGLDPRAEAEPRLNAWVARRIGDPTRVRFAATTALGEELVVGLDELGLSALSAVLAAESPGHSAPSELEERVVHRLARQLPSATSETQLALLASAPSGSSPSTVGLGAFQALMRRTHKLITTHRPATAADLALPQDEPDEGLDDHELGLRADAAAAAYGRTLSKLEEAASAPSIDAVAEALWEAAGLGVQGAIPPLDSSGGTDPGFVDTLVAQAGAVVATMRAIADQERVFATESAGATPRQRVKHHTERVRILLGEQFPVLARFTVSNATALTTSHAARATLCGGDDLAPATWLQRISLVRAGAGRLAAVRGAAELLRSDINPDDLAVLQLPHGDGERWLALPFTDDVAEAHMAVVAECSGAVNFGAPLAGLFCDAWSETIPSREETTGLAFHHDAPGARPPQAILIAVPTAASEPSWSVETILDTVIEAHDLARIRAVAPDSLEWLGTLLPTVLLPESSSPDVPTASIANLAARAAQPVPTPPQN